MKIDLDIYLRVSTENLDVVKEVKKLGDVIVFTASQEFAQEAFRNSKICSNLMKNLTYKGKRTIASVYPVHVHGRSRRTIIL